MGFSKEEELKQLKTDEELNHKCSKIIDSFKSYTKLEIIIMLTSLHDSFIEICDEEGIVFLDVKNLTKIEKH